MRRTNSISVVLVLAGCLCVLVPAALSGQQPTPGKRVLRVVYFVPTDREPAADYGERVDRVMKEVQTFFRDGMKQNGHGPMTFPLERDDSGRLRIYMVQAKGPMRDYGRNDAGKVRAEVKAALARHGVNVDQETVIVFQRLLEWRGKRAVEIGPYVGGGGPGAGMAYVFDDEKLDPRLLGSKKPGGWYGGGPCSLGAFNSHYIGGVAHELGHGLGLPHDRERDVERPRLGASLMGAGNHAYGRELRGEGKGAFLSEVSALPLSVHPLFTGARNTRAAQTSLTLENLKADFAKRTITLTGQLRGKPGPIGVAAHNDPLAVSGDYDAVGWTCPVKKDGTFRLAVGEIKPGHFQLRLRAFRDNGTSQVWSYRYKVNDSGTPDLSSFITGTVLAQAMNAYRQRDSRAVQGVLVSLRKQFSDDAVVVQKVMHLQSLLGNRTLVDLADVPANEKRVSVSRLKMANAEVGWGSALRDQVLTEGDGACFLEVGNNFFTKGLYAHAPARHVIAVNRQWRTFSSKYGLQDGHGGSVVFVLIGDGKELYRSKTIRDHQLHSMKVDISGVNLLELRVENAGDGNGSDWGVWLNPELQR